MIVVTEDLVSGIHVMNATKNKVQCLINYGTKINPIAIQELNEFKQVQVWLDNDSPHVIEQANKYARTIALYGKAEVQVISDVYTDPKHYEASQIKDILRWIQ